jgi:hypothetical protein
LNLAPPLLIIALTLTLSLSIPSSLKEFGREIERERAREIN